MARVNLSAERLRELLHYDPATGTFSKTALAPKPDVPLKISTSDGYERFNVGSGTVTAHRAAIACVFGAFPPDGFQVDHINGDRADNRIANLRVVPRGVNNQNERKARVTSKSGVLGVNWHKDSKRWRVQVRLNHKTIHVGMFKSIDDAKEAYIKAKRELHVACTI